MSRPGWSVSQSLQKWGLFPAYSNFFCGSSALQYFRGIEASGPGRTTRTHFWFYRDKLREDCMLNRHWARMFLIVIVAASGIALWGQANSSLRGVISDQ